MKWFQKAADWAGEAFGSPWFLVFHLCWWGTWILAGIEGFPYGLLTLIVSLESIMLSGLILNSTNRQGALDRETIEHSLTINDRVYDMVSDIWDEVNPTTKEGENTDGNESKTCCANCHAGY